MLITLVYCLESPDLRVATTFFAILLNLFVNGHTLEDGIVFLQLHTIGRILLVLGCDITRSTGHSGLLVLGALENYLNAVSFLGHVLTYFTENPFASASFKTAEIPFLLIVFIVDAATFNVTQRSSSGM